MNGKSALPFDEVCKKMSRYVMHLCKFLYVFLTNECSFLQCSSAPCSSFPSADYPAFFNQEKWDKQDRLFLNKMHND